MKYLLLVVATILIGSCKQKAPQHVGTGIVDNALKDSVDKNTITERYWKLVELAGKAVPPPADGQREIHIKFRVAENKLEGFGGCNGLGGNYELKQGNRITIGNIIRTQIACETLDTENELVRVLESADNYNVSGDTLQLNKAKMAPLARFEAVYIN